ncbi:hypothetical protein Gpo141_00010650 [Globisporangium polare]
MVSVRAHTPLLVAAVLAAAFSDSVAVVATSRPRVHPGVHRTLRAQGSVNLIVTLNDSTESVLESVKEVEFESRGAKITSLVDRLEAHASTSQASLDTLLHASSTLEAAGAQPLFKSATSFWISNQVHFEDASWELVEKLSSLQSIAEVREEQVLRLPSPIASTATNASTTEGFGVLANEWGVTKIGAPSVWARGYNGQGVVVGIIDTGVLAGHTAIKNSFRSSYGWFDPISKTASPRDDQGHGTHVTGTITGSEGIGVAPGAKWIACKACASDGCAESDLIACGQFMTCPTTPSGASKDCSKAPHVVSNSWGGGQGDTFYNAVINAWRAAEIIPIFATGNEGPACKTASSPGDSKDVIAVGATTTNDGLADFSSKGPSSSGLLKPEISAPGSDVRSAWNTGTNAYNTISGTSMATPHVSGVVALLLSARGDLKYTDVINALRDSAQRSALKPSGNTCGGTTDAMFPNNQYGYGRVSALAAFNSVVIPTQAPTPAPTEAPTSKPLSFDRCSALSEVFCGELLCEWSSDSGVCGSWL